jgi:AraC family transcriptional regulator
MTLTNKALWTIERNLHRTLCLSEIADSCGVSNHHLAHAFGEGAGVSVMQYVRARRLTIAAHALAKGAPDILQLALDAGYGSHEAFTRAFHAQFSRTPEMIRRAAGTEDLIMTEAAKTPDAGGAELENPRFESSGPIQIVGLAERHSFSDTKDIPGQWRKFMARYAEIEDKTNPIPIGVSANMDDDGNFEYFCAAEVAKLSSTPRGLTSLRVPAQTYAIFLHRGHVSKIGATYAAIWNQWFPAHRRRVADGPSIERHLEEFDPKTGLGGVEIWIPVEEA